MDIFLIERVSKIIKAIRNVIGFLASIFTLVVILLMWKGVIAFSVLWFLPFLIQWAIWFLVLIVLMTFALILYIADNK